MASLAVISLALAACGTETMVQPEIGPPRSDPSRALLLPSSSWAPTDSALYRVAHAAAAVASLAAGEMVLTLPGGFVADVTDAECAAQGNTVTITSPVNVTLTSDGCHDVGASYQNLGPFPAGTTITLSFFSGYTGSPGAVSVSGAYPEWTVAMEDGFDNDFNDVIVTVRALVSPAGCPPEPWFSDPLFRNALNMLWDLSYPDADFADRRERAAFIVEDNGAYHVDLFPVNSDPCNLLDLATLTDYDLLPDSGVVGWIHTHPGSKETVPEGACQEVSGGAVTGAGPSPGDLSYLGFLERTYPGQTVKGIIIEPDAVNEFDSDNPFGTTYNQCTVGGTTGQGGTP